MWKHNSKAENQIGDYDYYVYDDPRMNPLQITKSKKSDISNLVTEIEADSERKVNEKENHKKELFKQLTRKQIRKLYKNYKVDFDMFGYEIGQ